MNKDQVNSTATYYNNGYFQKCASSENTEKQTK
uniref:Uncharacterized protein n=1 Tax=Arundo donax TaxID=35708 RepID=A0A0A9PW19_ARUDO